MNNVNLIILLSCLAHFVVGTIATTRGIFVSSISNYYHLNIVQLGYIYSFYNIGLFISISLTGYLTRIFNLKKMMLISALSALIAFIILNVYHSAYSFVCLMTVMGVVTGINLSGGSYLVIRAIQNMNHGASRLLLTDFFFSLSGIILPMTFGYLLSQNFEWFRLYNMLILPCVGMIYLTSKIDFSSTNHHKSIPSDNSTHKQKKVSIYLLAFSSFFFILSESVLTLWLVSFYQSKLQLSLIAASLLLTLYWLSKAAGLFINQFTVLKLGVHNYLSISTTIGILSIIAMLQSSTYYPVISALILLGFVSSGVLSSLVSYACSQLDTPCPKTVSLIYSAGTGGALISAWLSSVIVHSSGMSGAMKLVMISYFLCFACVNVSTLFDRIRDKSSMSLARQA